MTRGSGVKPTVCFVSASHQNAFFEEIEDALADAISDRGYEVTRSVDRFPPGNDDTVCVYVPHEYHALVEEPAHPTPAQLARTVVVSTEQPGNSWFELAFQSAHRAGAVVDINHLGHAELLNRGVPAIHLPLGYLSSWASWDGSADVERDIDVMFMGAYSTRRGAALGSCAGLLWNRRSELRFVDSALPQSPTTPGYLHGRAKWDRLARTKVLVNIHREEMPYFEWHRLIGAMCNGCVVLSENSVGCEPLVPGEHFVSCALESMPIVLDELLRDEALQARIRAAALDILTTQLPVASTADALEDAIARAARNVGLAARDWTVPPSPKPPQDLAPAYEVVAAERSDPVAVTRMALKQVIMGQRRLASEIRALRGEMETQAESDVASPPAEDLVEVTPAYTAVSPRVSIVLTVYNYADVVERAIDSVGLSHFEDYELVVVNDCSPDGSAEAIRAALEARPWIPAKVVTRASNGGLSSSRNLGIREGRGEFIFILDADNAVYPTALGRLVAALDEDPGASFAYNIHEQFQATGSVGLLTYLPWEPRLLKRGNYIDAMAMIRKSVLEDLGGYSSAGALASGWEDFDLWCSMADHGLRGVFIPEMLSRYHVGEFSMISMTTIDVNDLWATLLSRHPFLISSDPAPDISAV